MMTDPYLARLAALERARAALDSAEAHLTVAGEEKLARAAKVLRWDVDEEYERLLKRRAAEATR